MKTLGKYILNEKGEPVKERDLIKWATWLENSLPKRIVAKTGIGDCLVSTVFIGLDYAFGGGTPVLWETIVFSEKELEGDYTDRYHTKEEALKGHEKICDELRRNLR